MDILGLCCQKSIYDTMSYNEIYIFFDNKLIFNVIIKNEERIRFYIFIYLTRLV